MRSLLSRFVLGGATGSQASRARSERYSRDRWFYPGNFDTGYRHTGTVSILLCTLPYRVKNSEQASAIILIMIYEVKCYYTKLDQKQTKCIAVERNCKDNDERSTMKGIRSAERRLHCTRPGRLLLSPGHVLPRAACFARRENDFFSSNTWLTPTLIVRSGKGGT